MGKWDRMVPYMMFYFVATALVMLLHYFTKTVSLRCPESSKSLNEL